MAQQQKGRQNCKIAKYASVSGIRLFQSLQETQQSSSELLNSWAACECALHNSLWCQILPVVSVSDLLLAISWTYHDIAAAGLDVRLSPLQVQGPGIFCLVISAIHRSAPAPSDQRWRLTTSQRTGTRSAVEAFCVMRFRNQRSSSSSSSPPPPPQVTCDNSLATASFQFQHLSALVQRYDAVAV